MFLHTAASPGVSTGWLVSPQPEKDSLCGRRVWALSSRRARRQHAVWETAWKSASVNTPRPHVLPGQRGWPLSRHICTQSLRFWREPAKEMEQGAGRRGEFPRRREPVTAALLMKAMTSERSGGGMNAAGANSQRARSNLCSRASAAPC